MPTSPSPCRPPRWAPWESGNSAAGFSYPLPSLRGETHNANFLADALLYRAFKHTGDEKFLAPALRATRHSAAKQHADGSWFYGERSSQRWIDNFHTGYNLDCLKRYIESTGDREYEARLQRGFEYFTAQFFETYRRGSSCQ